MTPPPPSRFALIDRTDPRRAAVEALIRTVYQARYGADVPAFPDRLAAIFDADGLPHCAAGLRDAASGFFSEVYLDRPVEEAISALALEPAPREAVLEVTTLAAARPGAAFTLIDRITADGRARGMRWGLFTATRPLRHGLLRAGAGLIELGRADPGRLADAGCWGRYYETDPFVCAVAGDACMSRAAAQSASGQKAWGQKASGRTVSDARSTPSRSDRTAHA